ncbi:hypothetical protein NEHOM01_2037 [Nematocida homosporus]|uniref:uncharacterized protein n=1 Tax=Nematocida homosporus TaxID=1912981 RepID=UPI00221F39A2|nr:uncharacterized protein NEHOM01_2037 [Nematocida homosporus]KAI5187241.1 hypothetical protein NEHOM01_2037 [Nematocida homosporus]
MRIGSTITLLVSTSYVLGAIDVRACLSMGGVMGLNGICHLYREKLGSRQPWMVGQNMPAVRLLPRPVFVPLDRPQLWPSMLGGLTRLGIGPGRIEGLLANANRLGYVGNTNGNVGVGVGVGLGSNGSIICPPPMNGVPNVVPSVTPNNAVPNVVPSNVVPSVAVGAGVSSNVVPSAIPNVSVGSIGNIGSGSGSGIVSGGPVSTSSVVVVMPTRRVGDRVVSMISNSVGSDGVIRRRVHEETRVVGLGPEAQEIVITIGSTDKKGQMVHDAISKSIVVDNKPNRVLTKKEAKQAEKEEKKRLKREKKISKKVDAKFEKLDKILGPAGKDPNSPTGKSSLAVAESDRLRAAIREELRKNEEAKQDEKRKNKKRWYMPWKKSSDDSVDDVIRDSRTRRDLDELRDRETYRHGDAGYDYDYGHGHVRDIEGRRFNEEFDGDNLASDKPASKWPRLSNLARKTKRKLGFGKKRLEESELEEPYDSHYQTPAYEPYASHSSLYPPETSAYPAYASPAPVKKKKKWFRSPFSRSRKSQAPPVIAQPRRVLVATDGQYPSYDESIHPDPNAQTLDHIQHELHRINETLSIPSQPKRTTTILQPVSVVESAPPLVTIKQPQPRQQYQPVHAYPAPVYYTEEPSGGIPSTSSNGVVYLRPSNLSD